MQPLHPGETVRVRGERWVVIRQSVHTGAAAIDLRGIDASNAGQHARFLLPFEPIERVATQRIPTIVRPAEWRLVARSALAAVTPRIDALRAAAGADFDVMPYQLEPALAITSGLGCRLLIADEVGLGKTVQAGLIVAELLERTPEAHALVICPAGLRSQWQEELRHRFHLSAELLDAAGIARTASQLDGSANPWSASPLVIASIDFIKRPEVMRAVEGLVWDVIVLDEAHNLATRSDRATAAAAIAARARTVVLLSATPHSGDESAFARLCALGDVRDRFPLLFFRRTRADAGIPVVRRTRWLHVQPTTAELKMHGALHRYASRVWHEQQASVAGRLAVSVLLRRAASSATSLARSVERRLEAIASRAPAPIPQLELPFMLSEADEEPLAILAAPALSNAEEEHRHLEDVLELARAAAPQESKVDVLRRWLARVDEPVIVFTEYRDTLAHLRTALATCRPGTRLVELHGGMTRSERAAAERSFANGDAAVMLATDAASEGLNLHHRCRCVINLETPWSPVRLEQRIGRVDRIGQRQPVHAVQLIAAGTLEPAIVRRVMDRARRAAGALRDLQPTDIEVATAVLTGADIRDRRPGEAVPPPLLRRPDLRSVAAAEAVRIATARRLQPARPIRDRRPIVTTARMLRGMALAVFEIVLVDGDGMPVWNTIIGVTGQANPPARDGRALRDAVTAFVDGARGSVTDAAQLLFRGDVATCEVLTTTQLSREQAIVGAVRLRHARIAADLLQPGLFDRRAERQAASQSAVLEEALGRCTARVDALGRLATLTIMPPTWRWALLTR